MVTRTGLHLGQTAPKTVIENQVCLSSYDGHLEIMIFKYMKSIHSTNLADVWILGIVKERVRYVSHAC